MEFPDRPKKRHEMNLVELITKYGEEDAKKIRAEQRLKAMTAHSERVTRHGHRVTVELKPPDKH